MPDGRLDHLAAQLGWHGHRLFRHRLADPSGFAAAVVRHMAGAAEGPLQPRLSALRYKLRRDGFDEASVAECFGLYCAAGARWGNPPPSAQALGAAHQLLAGRIVEHAEPAGRIHALALAAAALAIHGTPVHVLAASIARAQRIAAALRPIFDTLGVSFACVAGVMSTQSREQAYRSAVVCSAHRDVATAYLQDRLQMAGRSRLLLDALSGEAARSGRERQLLLPGLRFALVDEADQVLLDDAYAPVTVSIEVDQSQERLLYEQAMELARAFAPEQDFTHDEQGMRLTETGAERLTRLVAPLGGVWGAREQREELVRMALGALHAMERGVDYQVIQGRVVFPKPDPASGEEVDDPDPVLVKFVELKEGCRLTGARDVLARISVPRFFRRYLNVAGMCADARGCERDYWELYNLKTTLAGQRTAAASCAPRIFRNIEAKRAAVIEAVLGRAANESVVVAVRAPREAQALLDALRTAGIPAGQVRGIMDDGDQAVLASLDHAGGVAVVLFPADCNVTRPGNHSVNTHLIVAELHDAGRQVARIGRAFGASSCEMLLALDEEGVAPAIGYLAAAISRVNDAGIAELPARQSRWIAGLAQQGVERARSLMRRDLILRDDYMSDLLAFSGRRE